MSTVTITSKYKITIPKGYRGKYKPGQKLQVFQVGNRIVIFPLRKITEARGFLKGIDTNFKRED